MIAVVRRSRYDDEELTLLTGTDVRAKRFAATKFREGYAQDQVDAFLDRVATTLDGLSDAPAVSADDVVQVRFNPTKFSAGYDQDEVDDFLDEIVSTLRGRAGGPDGATAAAPVPLVERGTVPPALRILQVLGFAVAAVAIALLWFEVGAAEVALGLLAAALVVGVVVERLVSRAKERHPGGVPEQ